MIVQQIVHEWNPHVWINVHSGMEALFMPFDHKASIPQGPEGQAQLGMLNRLNGLVCGSRCAVGSGGKSVGYLAHGTATDHMFLKERVPLAFTWEIYGDTKAHYNDCFRMFNPLTKEHLKAVVDAWVPGFLHLLPLLEFHPRLASFMRRIGIPARSQHGSSRAATSAALTRMPGRMSRPPAVVAPRVLAAPAKPRAGASAGPRGTPQLRSFRELPQPSGAAAEKEAPPRDSRARTMPPDIPAAGEARSETEVREREPLADITPADRAPRLRVSFLPMAVLFLSAFCFRCLVRRPCWRRCSRGLRALSRAKPSDAARKL
uniref:Zn-dependent exopeptidase n=1 Tax=Tetraselmis sp. GSL018 TaxID=582737 RepID=A0A061SCP5_9CHLO